MEPPLTILDQGRFAATGGDWLAEAPHFMFLALGPRWKDANNIVPEAQWFSSRYAALKRRFPTPQWRVMVDLGRIPQWKAAPIEMSRIYARMTQDSATERVAIIRSTAFHRSVIKMFMWTVRNAGKFRFFDTLEEAETWLAKPPSTAVRALLASPAMRSETEKTENA